MFKEICSQIPRGSLVICDIIGTFYKRKGDKLVFTDLDGFIELWKHVRGNLIFLTGHPSHRDIHSGFKKLNLTYADYTVLYTSIPKGDYLKNYKFPTHTVFIDNNINQIRSVQRQCPSIQTFYFK